MSNGVAYVIDEAGTFTARLNRDMVELADIDNDDVELLQKLIREHEEKTVSARARTILVQWNQFLPLFRKVVPKHGAALVAETRTKYLESPVTEPEVALERRTA
jgi:glutamate synthase domain-containing protein 3